METRRKSLKWFLLLSLLGGFYAVFVGSPCILSQNFFLRWDLIFGFASVMIRLSSTELMLSPV